MTNSASTSTQVVPLTEAEIQTKNEALRKAADAKRIAEDQMKIEAVVANALTADELRAGKQGKTDWNRHTSYKSHKAVQETKKERGEKKYKNKSQSLSTSFITVRKRMSFGLEAIKNIIKTANKEGISLKIKIETKGIIDHVKTNPTTYLTIPNQKASKDSIAKLEKQQVNLKKGSKSTIKDLHNAYNKSKIELEEATKKDITNLHNAYNKSKIKLENTSKNIIKIHKDRLENDIKDKKTELENDIKDKKTELESDIENNQKDLKTAIQNIKDEIAKHKTEISDIKSNSKNIKADKEANKKAGKKNKEITEETMKSINNIISKTKKNTEIEFTTFFGLSNNDGIDNDENTKYQILTIRIDSQQSIFTRGSMTISGPISLLNQSLETGEYSHFKAAIVASKLFPSYVQRTKKKIDVYNKIKTESNQTIKDHESATGVQNTQKLNTKLQDAINTSNANTETLKNQKENLQSTKNNIDKIKENLCIAEQKKVTLENNVRVAQLEFDKVNVAKVEIQANTTTKSLIEAEDDLKTATTEWNNANAEVQRLKNNIAEAKQKIKKETKNIDAEKKKIKNLEAKTTKSNQVAPELANTELTTAEDNLKIAKDDLIIAKDNLIIAKDALKQKATNKTKVFDARNIYNRDNVIAQKNLKTAQDKNTNLTNAKDALKQKTDNINQLTKEKSGLEANVNQLKDAIVTSKTNQEKFSSEVAECQVAVNADKQEVPSAKTNLEKAEKNLEDLKKCSKPVSFIERVKPTEPSSSQTSAPSIRR